MKLLYKESQCLCKICLICFLKISPLGWNMADVQKYMVNISVRNVSEGKYLCY